MNLYMMSQDFCFTQKKHIYNHTAYSVIFKIDKIFLNNIENCKLAI